MRRSLGFIGLTLLAALLALPAAGAAELRSLFLPPAGAIDPDLFADNQHDRETAIAKAIGQPGSTPMSVGSMTFRLQPGGTTSEEDYFVEILDSMLGGSTYGRVGVGVLVHLTGPASRRRASDISIYGERANMIDEDSTNANFSRCGKFVKEAYLSRLYLGDVHQTNDCVLRQLGRQDKAVWTALARNFPTLVREAAALGDQNAIELDRLIGTLKVKLPRNNDAIALRSTDVEPPPVAVSAQTSGFVIPAIDGEGSDLVQASFYGLTTSDGVTADVMGRNFSVNVVIDQINPLLRIEFPVYFLKGERSRSANYLGCGENASNDNQQFFLSYGHQSWVNECIYQQMDQDDARRFRAIFAAVPVLVHAAATRDALAAKLDVLLQKKILEPAEYG